MAARCCCFVRLTPCIGFYAEVAGAAVREIDYEGGDMEFPLETLLEAITPSTRAVLIANPNNPTGTGVSFALIKRILTRASTAAVLLMKRISNSRRDRFGPH